MGVKPYLLFIDDEPSILNAIQVLLQPMAQEWDAIYTTRSIEALDLVKKMSRMRTADGAGGQEFSVVVSDLCMPGINGIDFFEVLHAVFPDTVRILLTGNTDAHLAIKSINDGKVHRYLSKSAIIEGLVPELAAAIGHYRKTKAQRDEAQSAKRARSLFLDTMSHEIRTPINGIMGMLQLLADTPLCPEQREYVADAMDSSRRLTRLFGDILDYAGLASGQGGEHDVAFEPGAVLRDVQAALQEKARDKGLAFVCEADAAVPPRVYGKEGLLRQILFHLAENAVKFTDTGGVRVTASLLPLAGDGACRLLFVVADSGAGIPDDRIEAVFQPFTQIEDSYSRPQQGAGLGLAIVQRLLRLLDAGCLAVESGGEGTSVYVSVRFSQGPLSERMGLCPWPRAPEGPTPSRPAPEAVLAVADTAPVVDVLTKTLRGEGLAVDVARDGNSALRLLAQNGYRLILVETRLPDMDGGELARIVRTSPGLGVKSRLPILGLGEVPSRRAGDVPAGIDAVLPLPLEAAAVRDAVQRRLGRKTPGA